MPAIVILIDTRPRAGWRWRGRHGAGAMRERRATKRADAEQRNARTLPARRRAAQR